MLGASDGVSVGAAAGRARALTSQEAKCEQEIGSCLARKDYAGAAVAQAEKKANKDADAEAKVAKASNLVNKKNLK